MNNFDYYNPTRILFGRDRLQELDRLIPPDARVLILTGTSSAERSGTLDKVRTALGGRVTHHFKGIEPNPRYETLMEAARLARREKITWLLAVGGGSVMDGTKFVALAALAEDVDLEGMLRGYDLTELEDALPLGTVVTLPATGSEMNKGAVVSLEDGKYHFHSEKIFPRFSILDPELTLTLPPSQLANGIIDTFAHTVEVYVTYPAEARFQDRAAEGLLQTLVEIAPKTLRNPEDYDARANLMWCSSMALSGLLGAGVPQDWTAHMIGHELTSLYGIDHGRSLAVLLPAIWTTLWREKREKLLQYASRVWNIAYGEDRVRIELAIDKTREFFESLGAGTRLRDYNLGQDAIGEILDSLVRHGMTTLGERDTVTLDVCRKILEEAL